MGHFHSTNLDTLLLDWLYAKGSASIKDVVEVAMRRGEKLSASEGSYEEFYMIQMGIETLMTIHAWRQDVAPLLDSPDKARVFQLVLDGDFEEEWGDEGESIGDSAIYDSIVFRFAKGKRKNFKNLVIVEVET